MDIDLLLKPCIYIYHGIMYILKLIGNFIKYFSLGLKRFPSLLVSMIGYSVLGIRNIFYRPKTKEKIINDNDKLLIEAKKNSKQAEIREETIRNKNQLAQEKNYQKELQEFLNDSNKLLDSEKPKKESLFKKIGFLKENIKMEIKMEKSKNMIMMIIMVKYLKISKDNM